MTGACGLFIHCIYWIIGGYLPCSTCLPKQWGSVTGSRMCSAVLSVPEARRPGERREMTAQKANWMCLLIATARGGGGGGVPGFVDQNVTASSPFKHCSSVRRVISARRRCSWAPDTFLSPSASGHSGRTERRRKIATLFLASAHFLSQICSSEQMYLAFF